MLKRSATFHANVEAKVENAYEKERKSLPWQVHSQVHDLYRTILCRTWAHNPFAVIDVLVHSQLCIRKYALKHKASALSVYTHPSLLGGTGVCLHHSRVKWQGLWVIMGAMVVFPFASGLPFVQFFFLFCWHTSHGASCFKAFAIASPIDWNITQPLSSLLLSAANNCCVPFPASRCEISRCFKFS